MKTQRVLVAILLLAGVLLACGVFYFASGGTTTEDLPGEVVVEQSDGLTHEQAVPEEGFVGAAKASVKKNGGAASEAGSRAANGEVENGRAREDYLNAMFRPMAAQGVEAAMARVRELPDAESRDMAMLALLGEWSGLTVTELAQRGDIGRFGVAGALALQLMNSGQITPQQAAGMANEFLSSDQRVGVLARSAEKLAATDPTTALAMGDGLTDWQQTRFLSRFVSGWASTAPDAARAWAMQVPDPRTRARLMGRVLAEQVKSDPVGAAQTFAQMPPEDAEVRERTARQIASQWAANDTLAAMQWSDSLSNPADRDSAKRGIRSAAPIGIGARLSTGNDGVPVLDSLVPGGPASASGELRGGDRVLAIADANGSWVNSRNRPLGDVVRLIQGEPNTSVTLQVQSGDGSPPRVVTLGREQIIFRPGS
jgi:PDZ domain